MIKFDISDISESIKASFSAHAQTYDQAASIHRRAAAALFNRMASDHADIPHGPILEVGCGTGNLSVLLDQEYKDRDCVFIDLSESMLTWCQARLEFTQSSKRRKFISADAERLFSSDEVLKEVLKKDRFAVIASSFTFQWFTDFQKAVNELIRLLAPKGKLYFCFPIQGSFREWRHMANRAEVPFTANPLPRIADLLFISKQSNCRLDFEEIVLVDHFPDSFSFFTAIKHLGAATRIYRETHSDFKLLRLTRQWDNVAPDGIDTTYRLVLGVLSK